jgi:hypothetical protein
MFAFVEESRTTNDVMQSRRKGDNNALTFCSHSFEIYDDSRTREEGDLKIDLCNSFVLFSSKYGGSVRLRKRE